MRLYVMGWNGLKTPVAKDDSGEALTEACFDAVTREMGKEAARELYYHVSGSFSLTREEVGNSGSPVNGDIDPTPLPTPSDDSESRDRKSTRLNSSHSCASRMPSSA